MECPKCHNDKFKHSGDDFICWNCGQLIAAPLKLHIIELPKGRTGAKSPLKGRPVDQVSAEIRAHVARHMAETRAMRMNGLGWKTVATKIGMGGGSKAAVQRHYSELSA